ncbi:hypothetical protein LZC95_49350 [Pendulispora brunnea]|uniref:Uncharacterized protein n=1 Tax=Pendulispora brunnea TaxID=2905690 RepID=A0ABZ2K6Y1_9BACT
MKAEIAEAMGQAPAERRARARAVVVHEGDEWIVDLTTEMGGPPHHRTLRAGTCGELGSAVATVLALEVSGGQRHELAPPPAAPASEKPRDEGPSTRRGGEASKRQFALSLGAAGATGATGDASLGVGGAISWLPARWRVELAVVYFPPTEVARGDLGIRGDFDLVAGSVGGCYTFVLGAVSLGPCLGAEVGRLHASGSGSAVRTSSESASLWLAGKAGGLAVWQLGRFALRMQLDSIIPSSRDRYLIERVGEVYRPPALGGRVTLGAEMHFP